MELDASLQTQFKLLLGSSVLAVAAVGTAWKCGFFWCPLRTEQQSSSSQRKIDFKDVLGAFLLFFGIMLLLPALIVFPFSFKQFDLDTYAKGWINVFSLVTGIVAMLLYCFAFNQKTCKQVWGSAAFRSFQGALSDFGLGVVTYLICSPVVGFIGQLVAILFAWMDWHLFKNEQVAVRFLKMTLNQPLLLLGTVILLAFAIPVIEEILFRGFLQNWILSRWGRSLAITLTTIMFALFHFSESQGLDNIELLLSLTVLGGFLGFLREKRQSLWAPIGLHATFNTISIAVIVYGS